MTAPKVLLLETTGPESASLADAAVTAGIEIHAVVHHASQSGRSGDLAGSFAGHVTTDLGDTTTAVADILGYAGQVGIDGVLTFSEFLTPIVALVCAQLGLPGNDPRLANAPRNKADMAQRFRATGVPTPTTTVVTSESDITALAYDSEPTTSWVVKPVDNAGSAGITIVHDRNEAMTAYRHARQAAGHVPYGIAPDPRVLIQDYVAGTEYSIESVTQNRMTTHLCITSKIVATSTHPVELGHSVPAPIAAPTAQGLLAAADQAIAAVGIHNSCSHTEIRLDPDGHAQVIEIAARPPAGHIGSLIDHALGINLWTTCLAAALGHAIEITPRRDAYATIRHVTSEQTGHLLSITNVPDLSTQVPAVRIRAKEGQMIGTTDSNQARLGHFVVVGPDAHSVDQLANDLLARVQITVDPAGPDHPVSAQ